MCIPMNSRSSSGWAKQWDSSTWKPDRSCGLHITLSNRKKRHTPNVAANCSFVVLTSLKPHESLARTEKSATRDVDTFGGDAGESLRNDGAGVSGFVCDAYVGGDSGASGAGADGVRRGGAAGHAARGNSVRSRGAAADHEGFAVSHRFSAAAI